MKLFFSYLLFFSHVVFIFCILNGEGVSLAGNTCGRPNDRPIKYQETKIVGGYDVGYYRYSWYVALVYPDTKSIACGASLIGSKAIVTAAHCFKEYIDNNNAHNKTIFLETAYDVLLGAYNKCEKEKTQKFFNVSKVYIHEKYKEHGPYYDIAVMILKESASTYQPICLPKSLISGRPNEGSSPGLGTLKYHGTTPCTLQEARLLIYSDKVCRKILNSTGNDPKELYGAFCAGYLKGGIDTCQGDSGGPFQVLDEYGNYILLGIVSFGFNCADPNVLGIYTDVSRFLTWIQKKAGFNSSIEGQNTTATTEEPIPSEEPPTVTSKPIATTTPVVSKPQVIQVIRPDRPVQPINIIILKKKHKEKKLQSFKRRNKQLLKRTNSYTKV